MINTNPTSPNPAPLTLQMEVSAVTFHAPDSGYSVLRCLCDSAAITAVGTFTSIRPGMHILASGSWMSHPRFGRQFKVSSWREEIPMTNSGIRKYLASKSVFGIGPVLADRLVDTFGEATIDVIENHPERLAEVPGVGKKKIEAICCHWQENKAVRDIIVFLKDHNVTDGLANKIYKQYGAKSIDILKENPYRIANDIWGVGFRIADQLALNLGVDRHSPFRLRAGLRFALEEAQRNGHMFLPEEDLVRNARRLMDLADGVDDSSDIAVELDSLAESKALLRLIGGEVYLPYLYEAETAAASSLASLVLRGGLITDSPDIDAIERASGLTLATEQRNAVAIALTHPVSILTGGPGTGKTTTVRAIITGLLMRRERVLLASPTGKAAKRMEEATGRPAMTIHRLLEYSPGEGGFQRNEENPLDAEALIVDESSMLDSVLLNSLLKAVPDHMRVIFVGDADQLPSVGPGSCLREMIASARIPTVRLTTIFRQAAGSDIIKGAHAVNAGRMPNLAGENDLQFVRRDPEDIADTVVDIIRRAMDAGTPLSDIQVLSPMKADTAGTEALNAVIQAAVNPDGEVVMKSLREFRVGDRVINIKNDYTNEVFNGDQGVIVGGDPETGSVTVRYGEKTVTYDAADTDCLLHSWAITVHRSQGSEFPCAIVVMSTSHWIMMQRTLFYTALTRASGRCFIVGSTAAMAQAVNNNAVRRRYTMLGDLVREYIDNPR